jgi:alpha-L-rhamnosidase
MRTKEMKTKIALFAMAWLAAAAPASLAIGRALVVERLRCEYLDNPLGIDPAEPRLSWELRATHEAARGLRQSAYQIQVASSADLLEVGNPDLWDSDKVASDETVGIVYAGEKLGSRDRCHWRVRVWDQVGEPSAWSEPALWTIGLLEPEDWKAKWIGDPNPAPPDSPPHRGYRSEPEDKDEQPKWVAIDLGRETAIDGIRLYGTRIVERGLGDVPGYLYPLRFRIETANKRDFSDAQAVALRDSEDVANPGCQPVTYRFPRKEVRYVRVWVNAFRADEEGKYGFALAELKALNVSATSPGTPRCLRSMASSPTTGRDPSSPTVTSIGIMVGRSRP